MGDGVRLLTHRALWSGCGDELPHLWWPSGKPRDEGMQLQLQKNENDPALRQMPVLKEGLGVHPYRRGEHTEAAGFRQE